MSARDGIGMTSERTRLRMIDALRREGIVGHVGNVHVEEDRCAKGGAVHAFDERARDTGGGRVVLEHRAHEGNGDRRDAQQVAFHGGSHGA